MTGTGSLLDKSSSPVCASECVVGTFKSTIKKKKKRTERQDKKESREREKGKPDTRQYVLKLHQSQLFPTQQGYRKREEVEMYWKYIVIYLSLQIF